MYNLTPSRKTTGMALARKSMKKVADQCLFCRKSHNYALRNIGKTVLKEVKSFVYLEAIQ